MSIKFSKPVSMMAPTGGSSTEKTVVLILGGAFFAVVVAAMVQRGRAQVAQVQYKDSIGKQRKYRSLMGIEEGGRVPREVDEAIDEAERHGLLEQG